MTVRVQDVLTIDAVFVGLELLRNEREITACSAATGAEIIADGVIIAGSPQMPPIQGRVLRVPRNRMTLETSPHRTRVVKEYPSAIEDVALVVQLATQAIADTDLQGGAPSAFGFNLQMVYDQDSGENAIRYLGSRLFIPTRDLHEQWGLVGGFGKLLFQEGPRQWTIALEPRLNALNAEKVFLDINLHVSVARLPEASEMEMLMRNLWNQAHDLIETIDGRGNA